jgi:hypothetical protein
MRTNNEDQCDHEWEVDNGSGDNTVDMFVNERQKKWDIKVKAGQASYSRFLGDTDLRMECNRCQTAIWVIQYAVCQSNTGSPYACDDCHEVKDDCYCEYCVECDEEESCCVCKGEGDD